MLVLCLKAHFSSQKLCTLARHFTGPERRQAYFNLWLIGSFGDNVRTKVSFASRRLAAVFARFGAAFLLGSQCATQSGREPLSDVLRSSTLSSAFE
ncbi:hypothetical protein E5C26_19920 [Serratia proteamaculans]|nr:hypothetical protein E5C26_19920 [Serratia proteamaculans]